MLHPIPLNPKPDTATGRIFFSFHANLPSRAVIGKGTKSHSPTECHAIWSDECLVTCSAFSSLSFPQDDPQDQLVQLAAVLSVGSRAVWPVQMQDLRDSLPSSVQVAIAVASDPLGPHAHIDAVLLHGDESKLGALQCELAKREGPVVSVERIPEGEDCVPLERLLVERALSVNTAAAGGNASLMSIG